jgi:succinate dehydrogenase/fumarate reductase flavoprotein subunit
MAVQSIHQLQARSDFYNAFNVVLLVVAGTIAVLIGVIAFLSNRTNKGLLRAKDEQAALDKRESDEKIASLTLELKVQEERTAKQEERAALAERQLAEIQQLKRRFQHYIK